MRLGIGIDTGGTYTDAVLYDLTAKTILGSAKALTTRHDLSCGILEALDTLPSGFDPPELVSISTTLATNACVENKMGRGKLIFLGGDRRTIDSFGSGFGLPPSSEIYLQDSGTTFTGDKDTGPDWDLFRAGAPAAITDADGIGVVEMYAMRNGAFAEKQAARILRGLTDIPVVCGHELSSELGCLQRAAGTLLNARLFPIIKEFIAAIKHALARRGITAPVVIVRSDGSLMSGAFAAARPVETLLCGPAASVMGALELSGSENAVVADMGGTTTDIAIVRNGVPLKAEDGIGVGGWKTFVKGLYIHTVGLGGDSAVHYRDGEVLLEPYRVIPLCIGCDGRPELVEKLRETVETVPFHTRYLHEIFVLLRDIAGSSRYTEFEKQFCEHLRAGPMLRRDAAMAAGKDEYTLEVSRLLAEGVVGVCGLTPTDIMHIRGDFTRYPAEASLLGARFIAACCGIPVEALCEKVYSEVKKKLYLHIVSALLAHEQDHLRNHGIDERTTQMILESYLAAVHGGRGFVTPRFTTDLTLVGIGAPIHIFLPDVAALLGTKAVVPDHSEVANAVGAIVGNVCAAHEIMIRPVFSLDGVTGYSVMDSEERKEFGTREEAEEYAFREAERRAADAARERGAGGNITVSASVRLQEAHTREGTVYLGSTVTASAVGSAAL